MKSYRIDDLRITAEELRVQARVARKKGAHIKSERLNDMAHYLDASADVMTTQMNIGKQPC